ncbi:MAG: hypothetical protein K1X66_02320 [Verrucomicrobiae bacterium]|nr:hypothetical protein [Verrucomicrobiae bacterium]
MGGMLGGLGGVSGQDPSTLQQMEVKRMTEEQQNKGDNLFSNLVDPMDPSNYGTPETTTGYRISPQNPQTPAPAPIEPPRSNSQASPLEGATQTARSLFEREEERKRREQEQRANQRNGSF